VAENAASERRRGWSLLRRNRAFGLLCTARTVSFAGDSLAHIALVLYVANRGGGGPAVATLLLVSDFSPSLLGPVLGALGDRMDRRRLMIITQLLQAGVVLAIAAWLPALPGLLILVAVNANLARAFQPASSSAVPQLVADADLGLANSIIGFGTYGLAIAGPLAAAALTPLVGIRGVLAVDAISFVISVVLLWRLPALPPVARSSDQGHRSGIWHDAAEGLRYLWSNRIVRVTILGFGALIVCTALDDVALVLLARHTLHTGNSAASLLYAGADVGLLVGFIVLTRIPRIPAALLFIVGITVSSAGNILTGLSWLISLAIGSQIVRGIGLALQDTGSNTLLQRHVPTGMQSRVFGNLYTAIGLAAGISYLAGGIALASISPRVVLAGAGAAGLLVSIGTAIALARATAD
jgi:MFS family permease